jgi:transposase
MSRGVERSDASGEAFALCPPGEGRQERLPKPSNDTGCGRRYKQGQARHQAMLLPPSVEDYIGADNLVRAIDAYVESLDLAALGFSYAAGALRAGQPAFHPGDLLKLYLYGYLNRVRSSRRLEAECGRNLEVMWLLNGLTPSYHTIADFRKDNAQALRATCRDFVVLCGELGMIGGKRVGLDGSFFNASASDGSIKTKKQLESELAAIARDFERYHQELDGQDAEEADAAPSAVATVVQLEALKARAQRRREQIEQLTEAGETQLSRTDPDARRLRKNGQKVTGYNVQSVVDDEHKLIITHEVTNAGNDLGQLVPMIEQAQAVLAEVAPAPDCAAPTTPNPAPGEDAAAPAQVNASAPLEALADAGYFTESDIAACQARGITVYVPLPEHKGNSAEHRGLLANSTFHYDAKRDCYRCPGGQTLNPVGKPVTRSGVERQRYRSRSKVCAACTLRAQCLGQAGTRREIERSEHAEAVERHRVHMQSSQAQMRERAGLCEHPFGTLKRWLGWDHFLVRGFEKVRGEMALLVNCYNLRRVLSILGIVGFIAACRKRRQARPAGPQGKALLLPFFLPRRRPQRFSAPFNSRLPIPASATKGRSPVPTPLPIAA